MSILRTIAQITAAVLLIVTSASAAEPKPPEGYRALFNGKDLTGWYGLNPHSSAKLSGHKKEENLRSQREQFSKNWTVDNGELVNDGHGPYATTKEEFGDIDFLIEYKTVPKADSGIYLRGTPQVQIWDWNQTFDPKRPTRKPHLGSGGLFNNTPGTPGRDPMVIADKPFGQWNRFRIRQVGDLTWVWLNGQRVVDGAVMENYWDRKQPLPVKGPIMLQTHGGEIRWRNIFVREIGEDEAKSILTASTGKTGALSDALTLHPSFDRSLDADFSRGDRTSYVRKGKELHRSAANGDAELVPDAGRFGGALRFPAKSGFRPAFKDRGVLGYNGENWNLTFGWDPSQVLLVLGAAYVGHMDDLAVFNRSLSYEEVRQMFQLENGVRDLYAGEDAQ